MIRKIVLLIGLTIFWIMPVGVAVAAGGPDDLAAVRAATARFHQLEVAQAGGWNLVPGMDHCFTNPGVGSMGYHYINQNLLDLHLDPLQPESLVYAPGPNGQRILAAVEYVVPAAAWDAAGNAQPPELHGRSFFLNQTLGVYVLHAWIWKNNPAGIFENWNPKVSCDS